MNEDKIASEEQARIMKLLQESVTELFVRLKEHGNTSAWTELFNSSASDMQLKMKVERSPEDYTYFAIANGNESKFCELMNKNGIDFLRANASFTEDPTMCGFIVNDDDMAFVEAVIRAQNAR